MGSNNRRKLDPREFRGFALADDLAPLVFIHGADTKAAQMFTLAHELAHIRLGLSAVCDARASRMPEHEVERWCNRVAAELLAPLAVVRAEYEPSNPLGEEIDRLARRTNPEAAKPSEGVHCLGTSRVVNEVVDSSAIRQGKSAP